MCHHYGNDMRIAVCPKESRNFCVLSVVRHKIFTVPMIAIPSITAARDGNDKEDVEVDERDDPQDPKPPRKVPPLHTRLHYLNETEISRGGRDRVAPAVNAF